LEPIQSRNSSPALYGHVAGMLLQLCTMWWHGLALRATVQAKALQLG